MHEFIKLLKRFVPPYKRYIALNVLFNVLSAILTLFSFAIIIPILEMLFKVKQAVYVFMPLGSASLKDVAVNNFYYYTQEAIGSFGPATTLLLLAVLLVIMTALKTGTAYMALHYMVPIRTGVVRDIRQMLFDKIVSLPLGFFSYERKGDLMARMTGDVAEIENSIMASLDMIFKNPILIIVCLCTMVMISWQLTLFVLILLPIAGWIMGRISKRLKRQSYEGQQQWGTLMSYIDETIGGLRVIKAFNAEPKARDRFRSGSNKFRDITTSVARRQSLAHPMSEFLGTTVISIVLWFGGSLILDGDSSIDAPSFIYYLIIFYSLINPAKDLSKAVYSVQKGLASMQRIDKILSAKNPIQDPEHPEKINNVNGSIKYKDVTFGYDPEKPVIKNINMEVQSGETIALVGPSGGGKTTLADMLPRFYDVQKGKIEIDGVDVRNLKVHDLRSLMGNVNQEAILFNDTIFNNIAFGVENATLEQVQQAAKVANAHDFITALPEGYDTNIGDRGCRLSGGQRQRLSIARAILKNPPILILDEATSALDSESEKLVQEALERLMKNRTTIVIAHRLSTIRNASKIYVISEGEIIEQGTHDELMATNSYYAHLVSMQNDRK